MNKIDLLVIKVKENIEMCKRKTSKMSQDENIEKDEKIYEEENLLKKFIQGKTISDDDLKKHGLKDILNKIKMISI